MDKQTVIAIETIMKGMMIGGKPIDQFIIHTITN